MEKTKEREKKREKERRSKNGRPSIYIERREKLEKIRKTWRGRGKEEERSYGSEVRGIRKG